jgi:NDP-sugar pyrophosphorylase family protein
MLTLVVLAAGMGSRYGGLKQLDPVGPFGETIIDYSVYDAVRAGFEKLVFVIRPEFESDFRVKLMNNYEKHAECHCVYQRLQDGIGDRTVPSDRTKPWGTGHAVLSAEAQIDGPFAVVNGDDFYGHRSLKIMAEFLSVPDQKEYAMVGYVLRNTLSDHGYVSRGVCSFDSNRYLIDVVERLQIHKQGRGAYFVDEEGKSRDLSGDEVVSLNLWGFIPTFLPLLRERFKCFLEEHGDGVKTEFLLPSAVNELIGAGKARVKVLPTDDNWFGITYREDKDYVKGRIKELISKGIYPSKLWLEA